MNRRWRALGTVALIAAIAACGQPATDVDQQRVVGGHAEPDGYDAVGYLTVGFKDPEAGMVMWDGFPFCTASLVADDVVVTAAHCVDWFGTLVASGATMGIGFGEPAALLAEHPPAPPAMDEPPPADDGTGDDGTGDDGPGDDGADGEFPPDFFPPFPMPGQEEIYEIASVIVHPDFYYGRNMPARNDIAVAFLREKVEGRTPLTLGQAKVAAYGSTAAAPYTFVGYGRQHEGSWWRPEPKAEMPEEPGMPIEPEPGQEPIPEVLPELTPEKLFDLWARSAAHGNTERALTMAQRLRMPWGDASFAHIIEGGSDEMPMPIPDGEVWSARRSFGAFVVGEDRGMLKVRGAGGGACWGDSGGPLLEVTADGTMALVGVTSGVSNVDPEQEVDDDIGCYFGNQATASKFDEWWTSVGDYVSWIEGVIAAPRDFPGCPRLSGAYKTEIEAVRGQCFQYSDFDNKGRWNLNLNEAGTYHLFAYLPEFGGGKPATEAAYEVRHAGAVTEVLRDQSDPSAAPETTVGAADGFEAEYPGSMGGWMSLGIHDFAAGGDQWLQISAPSGKGIMNRIRVVPVDVASPCSAAAELGKVCHATAMGLPQPLATAGDFFAGICDFSVHEDLIGDDPFFGLMGYDRQCAACMVTEGALGCGAILPRYFGGIERAECEWSCWNPPEEAFTIKYVEPMCNGLDGEGACGAEAGQCAFYDCDGECHASKSYPWEYCHDAANSCWSESNEGSCGAGCTWHACGTTCTPEGVPEVAICGG